MDNLVNNIVFGKLGDVRNRHPTLFITSPIVGRARPTRAKDKAYHRKTEVPLIFCPKCNGLVSPADPEKLETAEGWAHKICPGIG